MCVCCYLPVDSNAQQPRTHHLTIHPLPLSLPRSSPSSHWPANRTETEVKRGRGKRRDERCPWLMRSAAAAAAQLRVTKRGCVHGTLCVAVEEGWAHTHTHTHTHRNSAQTAHKQHTHTHKQTAHKQTAHKRQTNSTKKAQRGRNTNTGAVTRPHHERGVRPIQSPLLQICCEHHHHHRHHRRRRHHHRHHR